MPKIFKLFFSTIAASLFIIAVILVGTKSQLGNPTIGELNTSAWLESGPLELSPERARYALLYSIVENKSFQFSTDVARLATPDLGYKNGHFVSLFAPGTSLIMIPGYLLGKIYGASHLGATLTIGFFALLNTWLIYLIIKRLGGSHIAGLIGSLIFLASTPAFTYAGVIYQHHLSTFVILFSVLVAVLPPKLWRLAVIYFLFGFSIIIDYPNAFFMSPIIIYSSLPFLSVIKNKNNLMLILNPLVFISALAITIPLSLYLAINYFSYGNVLQLSNTVSHIQALDDQGTPVAGRGADERAISDAQNLGARKRNAFNFFKTRHLLNGVYAFSVSPDRGVFVFTPVMLLGIVGLVVLYRTNRHLTQTLLAVICLNILLYSMRSDPWGGWAFGPRYLIPAFSILSILIGIATTHYRRSILFLSAILIFGGYSIYVNTAGAVSSIANPPQVEVLGLEALTGRRERYSFDRNIELLQNGKSKSFIYETYLQNTLTPWQYYIYVSSVITGVLVVLCTVEFSRRKI